MNFSSCLLNLVSLLLLLLFSMTSKGVPDYELFILFTESGFFTFAASI